MYLSPRRDAKAVRRFAVLRATLSSGAHLRRMSWDPSAQWYRMSECDSDPENGHTLCKAVRSAPCVPCAEAQNTTKAVVLKALFAASVLALLVAGCTGGESDQIPAGHTAQVGHEVSVSALAHGGAVRCTATFPSTTIEPGTPTGVRFVVENISEPGLSVSEGAGNGQIGYLIERTRTGSLIQDTSHVHDGIIGGRPLPRPIPIGFAMTMPAYDPPVLHPGPVVITPVCALTPKTVTLPPVRLDVSATGQAPAAEDAIRRAVAAAGAAFSTCAPTRDQEWVMGTSSTRSGTPFNARCGALVLHNRGFVVVLLGIVSPPRAPAIDLDALASQLGSVKTIGVKSSVAVSVWRFVVTTEALREVSQFAVAQNCEGSWDESGTGVLSCRFPTEE